MRPNKRSSRVWAQRALINNHLTLFIICNINKNYYDVIHKHNNMNSNKLENQGVRYTGVPDTFRPATFFILTTK